jgi:hypothetical protein
MISRMHSPIAGNIESTRIVCGPATVASSSIPGVAVHRLGCWQDIVINALSAWHSKATTALVEDAGDIPRASAGELKLQAKEAVRMHSEQ